jgi:FkbM family methyltransferase
VLGTEYLRWWLQRSLFRAEPIRLMHNHLKLGKFANFSEYHSAPLCLSKDEFAFFMNHVPDEGQIIDVGANIGVVSLVLAKQYPDRMIHAIEPNPFSYPALVSNVALNGLENVQCHELAIADKNGNVLFNAHPQERATAAIAQRSEKHTKSVVCLTLDDFVAEKSIERVALLKVDVEGYEAFVFRGGSKTLREIKPSVVYFEVCPNLTQRRGFNPSEPAETLLAHGYRLFRLLPGGGLSPATLQDIATVTLENWVAQPH